MSRHRKGVRGIAPTGQDTPLTRAKVREVVAAIAAEVIAETAGRLAAVPKPKAAALRIGGGRRTARRRR
jgi:hypothetical protein